MDFRLGVSGIFRLVLAEGENEEERREIAESIREIDGKNDVEDRKLVQMLGVILSHLNGKYPKIKLQH